MTKSLPAKTVHTWAQLVRVQQLLLQKVEADLKSRDLPPLVWYDVLLELARHDKTGLRHRDLSQSMLLEKHNLSRLIDRMEREGLVKRVPCAEDRRGAFVEVTRRGQGLQKRMWPVYESAIEKHFASRLSPGEIVELNGLLNKLR